MAPSHTHCPWKSQHWRDLGSLGCQWKCSRVTHTEKEQRLGTGSQEPTCISALFVLPDPPAHHGGPRLCSVFNPVALSKGCPSEQGLSFRFSLVSLERIWAPGRKEMETRQGEGGLWILEEVDPQWVFRTPREAPPQQECWSPQGTWQRGNPVPRAQATCPWREEQGGGLSPGQPGARPACERRGSLRARRPRSSPICFLWPQAQGLDHLCSCCPDPRATCEQRGALTHSRAQAGQVFGSRTRQWTVTST